MDRQTWDQVREAFLSAAETPQEERSALLAALPPAVRAEVASMLETEEEAARVLEPADGRLPCGTQAGAYVIDEFVAQGGMGEVYRGHRGPDFAKQVAVKVLAPVFGLRGAERMFARERQMLAQVTHPNIVTLLDGGQICGRPYFVMEWVEGKRLDEWAADRTLTEKLDLFRQICAAVQTAHESLILHRDLKPSNILVTESGQAKLLDFGIAKLMDWASEDPLATRSVQRMLTLRYASPEQARGSAAGVPSDIYSLGLLLYELVSGCPAQAVEQLPMDEALMAITSRELSRPAGMDREIFLAAAKAAAKEPTQRYRSALEFGEDVRRFLRGYPVLAQPPSLRYRLRKFVKRNKAAAAIGAVAGIAVLGALGAFGLQYRIAQRERALAEKRFEAARQMAQLIVFDAPQKLAGVPDTLEVRQWAAERAAHYLEQMAKEVEGEVTLALSVARSYRQVAFQYFNTSAANLNDPGKALDALERGAAVLEGLRNKSAEVWVELIENRLARPYVRLRRLDDAVVNEREALALADRLREAHHPKAADLRARALYLRAINDRHKPEELIGIWGELESYYLEQLREAPDDEARMRALALVHKNVSGLHTARKEWAEALRHDRLAVALDERRLALKPGEPSVRMDSTFSYGRLGQDLASSGRTAEGIGHIRKALAIRRELAARDPQDRRARERLAWMLGLLAEQLIKVGETGAAQQGAREALLLLMTIGSPGSGDYTVAGLHRILALSFEKSNSTEEACNEWKAAREALPSGYVPAPGALLQAAEIHARNSACADKGSAAR